jgi:hypothetical protein
VSKEADQPFRPVHPRLLHRRTHTAELRHQCRPAIDRLRITHPHRLLRGQREQLSLFVDTWNLDAFIHHCFCNTWVQFARFRERPHLAAHRAHDLFRGLVPITRDRSCRADHRPRPHINPIGCERDHRARRKRAAVHIRVNRYLRFLDRIHDLLRRIDAAAGRFDVEDHSPRTLSLRLPNGPRDERRESQLDDAVHRHAHNRAFLWFLRRYRIGERKQDQQTGGGPHPKFPNSHILKLS